MPSSGDGVMGEGREAACGMSSAKPGRFAGRSRSNEADVGEKASRAVRFPRKREGVSASTGMYIAGEYWCCWAAKCSVA